MQVKRLSSTAILPVKANPTDAGYDLSASRPYVLEPRCKPQKVETDLAIAVPAGTYGQIAERSSMALKGLSVGGGVIDRGYQGPVSIIMSNQSDVVQRINPGDRVAQLILIRIADDVPVVPVDEFDTSTSRGTAGFGSSGVGATACGIAQTGAAAAAVKK